MHISVDQTQRGSAVPAAASSNVETVRPASGQWAGAVNDLFQRVATGEWLELPAPKGKGGVVHAATVGQALEPPHALKASDLGPPLSLADLTALDPTISKEEVLKIVKHSFSPDHIMRSFPGALWSRAQKAVESGHVAGGLGFCLGDAHGSNFGYMRVAGKTVYGYCDLDSPGVGPVGLDALKAMYLLKTETGSKSRLHDAVREYAEAVRHPDRAESPPGSQAPDWDRIQKHHISNYTHHGKLRLGHSTGLDPVKQDVRDDAAKLFASDQRLSKFAIKDVAKLVDDSGGAGGLVRYWVLAESKDTGLRIIELKGDPTPALDHAGFGDKVPQLQRLELIKQRVWGASDPNDYFTVEFQGSSFTVRDRMNMDSIDPTAMKKKREKRYIEVNMGDLAKAHSSAWGGMKRREIIEWLEKSMPAIEEWCAASFANIKKEYDAQQS